MLLSEIENIQPSVNYKLLGVSQIWLEIALLPYDGTNWNPISWDYFLERERKSEGKRMMLVEGGGVNSIGRRYQMYPRKNNLLV